MSKRECVISLAGVVVVVFFRKRCALKTNKRTNERVPLVDWLDGRIHRSCDLFHNLHINLSLIFWTNAIHASSFNRRGGNQRLVCFSFIHLSHPARLVVNDRGNWLRARKHRRPTRQFIPKRRSYSSRCSSKRTIAPKLINLFHSS